MKKALLSNIKHFVDSNVRQRIDRATANSSHFMDEDLQLVERQFEDLRDFCVQAEKRISSLLLSLGTSASLSSYTQNLQASLTNLSALSGNKHSPCVTRSSETNTPGKLNKHSLKAPDPLHGNLSSSQPFSYSTTTTNSDVTNNPPTIQPSEPASRPTNELSNNNLGNIHHPSAPAAATTNKQHKKLPIIGFFKFLVKSQYKLKPNSLLSIALSHCAQLQTQLTTLHLNYEQTIENECLKPLRNILENDLPNIVKLRRNLVRAHNELDSIKGKFNAAIQKQLQVQTTHFATNSYTVQQVNSQQANLQKLDQLKKEVDEAEIRFEQTKDNYAIELYSFVCRETELVDIFVKFYQYQTEYQQQASQLISGSLPVLANSLEGDEQHSEKSGQSNLLAVYQLFKDILRQDRRSKSSSKEADSPHSKSSNISRTISHDDTTSCPSTHCDTTTPFDVHATAGLLKLYLRELPQPLLTYHLYQSWIDVSLKVKNDKENLSELKNVVDQLPASYYDNLRLLIRFLHQLTCHSASNKMTATNLAITMAPSLISPQPVNAQENQPTLVDNAQMSSIGISASLHALVIEKLIIYAEELFSGPIQFLLPDIDSYTLKSKEFQGDEDLKSSSPAASSMASFSSFSSSASTSPTSDERDAGSADMLGDGSSLVSFHTKRPMSVHIATSSGISQKAPPVPPAPVNRSHRRTPNKSPPVVPDIPVEKHHIAPKEKSRSPTQQSRPSIEPPQVPEESSQLPEEPPKVPVKPPRSNIPKVSQSTPL